MTAAFRADHSAETPQSPEEYEPRAAWTVPADDTAARSLNRANEIAKALGLTPITGLSGQRIGY